MQALRRLKEIRLELKRLHEAAGGKGPNPYSLTQIGAALGISHPTLVNYENDSYQPAGRADFREGLARYCDWLSDQAIVHGRPDLALSRAQFAPDVFGSGEELPPPLGTNHVNHLPTGGGPDGRPAALFDEPDAEKVPA